MKRATQFVRVIEQLLLVAGLMLSCAYLGVRMYGAIGAQAALDNFYNPQLTNGLDRARIHTTGDVSSGPNYSLWSQQRIRAYKQSLTSFLGTPLAVLAISKIHLQVPVFDGVDNLTLDRGAGHIPGTAYPAQPGNLGIAGHRDGFFRGLKDVTPGDEIELITPDSVTTYVVDRIEVVQPQDVSVLRPRPVASLTLVTCYPFYFIGSAPERYIVSASLHKDAKQAVLNR